MFNILIMFYDIRLGIRLMNFINNKNKNLNVRFIIQNPTEAIKIINTKDNIDLIILDAKNNYVEERFLEEIMCKCKYNKSIIVISDKIKNIEKNQMIYFIIKRNSDFKEIANKIDEIITNKKISKEEKIYSQKIRKELLYLGYDISLKGTVYLNEIIKYTLTTPTKKISKLEKNIYPKIAEKYNTSAHNIKCRINSATTKMYNNCEIEKLKHYFNFNIDEKPKIKTIINTIIYKISF